MNEIPHEFHPYIGHIKDVKGDEIVDPRLLLFLLVIVKIIDIRFGQIYTRS